MKGVALAFVCFVAIACGSKSDGGSDGEKKVTPPVQISPAPVNESLITEIWSCDGTADINNTPETSVEVPTVRVTKFTTDDYFVTCMGHYSNSQFEDSDTSTEAEFYPPTSIAVATAKVLSCVSYHATSKFNIETHVVVNEANDAAANAPETVQCKKLFP